MRNLLTVCLPALALFALGGCAGTAALTSTEDDGVYYSSQDRTTALVSQAPAPANTNEAANPDYQGDPSGSSTARQGSGSTQYYDNTYSYMQGLPGYGGSSYYGPGVGAYAPYSPYTSLSISSGYGWGGGACGFSPYGFGGYDPFYSSLYSPYGYGYSPFGYSPYGYGSGLSISFGFGRPYGFGYSPYAYGYGGFGGGFYSPYYYNSPFYGGYYGRGGYGYSNGYYGGSYYGNGYNGGYSDRNNGVRQAPGRRIDRASDTRYVTGSGSSPIAAPGTPGTTTPGGGRGRSEMVAPNPTQPAGGMTTTTAGDVRRSRDVSEQVPATGYNNQPRAMDDSRRPRYRDMEQPNTGQMQPQGQPASDAGQVTRSDSRGRWRAAGDRTQLDQMQPQMQPQAGQMQPQQANAPEGQRRRGGFLQNVFGEPLGSGQAAEQGRQRSYDQSQQPQRSYEQPRQQRTYEQPQQRSYEQPQRTYEQPQQRSYEQPQRSYSQPSYSAPSGGGGGGGGGSRGRARE